MTMTASVVASLRRFAKRLPEPVQEPLRGIVRAWRRARGVPPPAPRPRTTARAPASPKPRPARPRGPKLRTFELRLPQPPPPETGRPSPSIVPDPPRTIRISAPANMYVPKVLEPTGLAGYDASTLACFLAVAESLPVGTVLDIGANVGIFSLLLTAVTRHRVVAFEPTPDLAAVIRDVASANGLSPGVEDAALGREDGTATLYLSPTDTSNSLLEGFRKARGALDVRVERLDSWCARAGAWPRLVKVDTEATEPDVLRGAQTLLREHRPWLVCEVLAGRTEPELTELLRPHGYHWFRIDGPGPLAPRDEIAGDTTYEHLNWLFAPEPPTDELWRRMAAWHEALAACGPIAPPGGGDGRTAEAGQGRVDPAADKEEPGVAGPRVQVL